MSQHQNLHTQLRSYPVLTVFTTLTRLVLAAGFIPSGLKKVLGVPFTILSPETSVGYFFDGFFQSGAYYGFVGWMQLLAAALLLIPRTSLAGALLYLPIIGNIFVITASMHFKGTWVLAGMMLLANLWLLVWDMGRLRALLEVRTASRRRESILAPPSKLLLLALGISAVAAQGGVVALLGMRGTLPGSLVVPAGTFALAVGLLATAAWWETVRRYLDARRVVVPRRR